jgi:hypothetical protein
MKIVNRHRLLIFGLGSSLVWAAPSEARFLQVDPVGYDDQFNLYVYVGNDPVNFLDHTGTRSVVNGEYIRIIPWDTSVPRVVLYTGATGARGITGREASFHHYAVATDAGRRDRNSLGTAIAEKPTPGPANRPATISGQINNAGRIPLNGNTNLVQSYRVPSPDPSRYTDITVNYTISGSHGLNEGFVMRYGEVGENGITLRTYGEGNAWEQNPALSRFWVPEVEQTWRGVDRRILESRR